MQAFIHCKISPHVSGVYRTHHQEHCCISLDLINIEPLCTEPGIYKKVLNVHRDCVINDFRMRKILARLFVVAHSDFDL